MPSISPVLATQIIQICENPQFAQFLKIVKRADDSHSDQVCEPQLAKKNCLCFVSTKDQLGAALKGQASIVIALAKLEVDSIQFPNSVALFSAASISAAMVLILPLFDPKKSIFPVGIHPSASIDPSAKIGKAVHIGAFAVIGPKVQIGDYAIVAAQTVVEKSAQIGHHTLLHSHVFIGSRCIVGHHCEIHPHTSLGSDGFSYVQGPDQRRNKIPQLGIVVLEDFVEVGSQCAFDRATLGETRIGEGSKFDNLCHVAHNCRIGKNNVFAAGFAIAGSSEVGDNCTFAGGVLIADHVKVGSGIMVGGKAGITKDVSVPGAYTGYPLEPIKDGMKTIANLANLTKMRRQLHKITKLLGLKDEDGK